MNQKTIIFDLDGTLIDYGISVEKALEQAVKSVDPKIWDDHTNIFTRDGYQRAYNQAADKKQSTEDCLEDTRTIAFRYLMDSIPSSKGELADKVSEAYSAIRVNSLYMYEDVNKTLENIASICKIGLLSNGPSDVQWEKINKFNLVKQFEHIVVSGDIKSAKPSTSIFEYTLQKMGATGENSIYVGNSQYYDVQGAKKAGLISVWLNRKKHQLVIDLPKPDFEIRSLTELLPIVS